jgi:N-acetyl-anhydromuramyl-L-alanine amidase AmpD
MSKLINGELQDKNVIQKIYKGLHHGKIAKINAIVVHQTGASSAQHTFNSYQNSSIGAHFLIDKQGVIYQTALTNQIAYHVGRLKSKCIDQPASCNQSELTAANAMYLQKGISYSLRVKNLHAHENAKNYPDRYPTNNDSVGIEIVGSADSKSKSYEAVNATQNASLKWLVNELSINLGDVYRHPTISYKQPSEASTAAW